MKGPVFATIARDGGAAAVDGRVLLTAPAMSVVVGAPVALQVAGVWLRVRVDRTRARQA